MALLVSPCFAADPIILPAPTNASDNLDTNNIHLIDLPTVLRLAGAQNLDVQIPLGLFVADLAWSRQKSPPGAEDVNPLMAAPELCIEVVSPSNSRQELREKTAAYLAAGAEEVWIVYPRSKRVEVHDRQGLLQHSRFPVDLADLFD